MSVQYCVEYGFTLDDNGFNVPCVKRFDTEEEAETYAHSIYEQYNNIACVYEEYTPSFDEMQAARAYVKKYLSRAYYNEMRGDMTERDAAFKALTNDVKAAICYMVETGEID